MTLTVGSLFSGIGGLDLGLERAGMTVRWQAEVDPYCCRVLAKHWPDTPNLGDVTAVDWSTVERVDLICGGYPCQPFSLAGGRRGEADHRHLWPYVADALRHLRPRYALMENVAGHLSLGFGRVLGDLAEIGYDAEWDCIPAAAVGAPHRRDRVFIVAYPQRDELRREPVAVAGRGGAAIARDDGPPWHVADTEGHAVRTGLRAGEPGRLRWRRPGDRRRARDAWAAEPDVGRVADGVPAVLDGGLDAHESCRAEARAKGVPSTRLLRALRGHLAASAAPPEHRRCALCGHPLSGVPCHGACAPWRLGSGGEEAEDLRCLREGVLGLLAHAGEDVQPYLSLGGGASQRTQTVGHRSDRLRALGNAVVPQVAELIGRMIVAADREAVR